MQHRAVHWTEGMFLRPQHFQAADHYWHELLATSQRFDEPYNYGFRAVEISADALSNNVLQLDRCQARTRDGAIVDYVIGQGGQELNRLDLKDALADQAELTVYLSIPKLKIGRANQGERFEEALLPVPDESRGGNEQELAFRELRVTLSTRELQGFDSLPLVRIKRTGGEDSVTAIDRNYFPPMLAVDGWQPLGIELIRGLYDYLGEKLTQLSQMARERRLSFSSGDERDVEVMLKTSVVNQAYSVLHCLTFAHGVHPFYAYTELCRVVGMLSVFHESRRVSDIPPYDHDDLATIFTWVDLRIRQLLGREDKGQAPYIQRWFEGRPLGMRVTIDPDWLHSGWEWFVGVNGHNITDAQCRGLLGEGRLNWKMGCEERVDAIFQFAVPDVDRIELRDPPTVLPTHQGWIFYRIDTNTDNAAWRDVKAEETLAIRFAEHYVANKETLVGQRKLEVRHDDGKAVMEFALFAIPPRPKER